MSFRISKNEVFLSRRGCGSIILLEVLTVEGLEWVQNVQNVKLQLDIKDLSNKISSTDKKC